MTDGLISRVPSLSPTGDWLADLRARASSHLLEEGFPGKKHERWRFTSVRALVDTAFETTRGGDTEDVEARVVDALGDDGTWRLVLESGHPRLTAAGTPPDGVSVRSLRDVIDNDAALVAPLLGDIVAPEQFAALNGALFQDGVVIVVAPGAVVEQPIHLVYTDGGATDASSTASYPRAMVIAGDNSQCTLIESFIELPGRGASKHLTNVVAELSIGANARLDHVRVTQGTERSLQLGYLGARLARDARYASQVVAVGGALTRLELNVRFDGPGAEAELDGAYHVQGTEHVDHHVRVEHVAGRCTSRVRYRGLLDDRSHAVFDVIGVVHEGAVGSAAHQENRNLLLSDDATVDTKPHLEIECDEVTASHGATVGALDDAQLFYLRSRAIPEEEARNILQFAFVREPIDRIQHAPIVTRTSTAILRRLPNGEGLMEGLST